MYTASVNLYFKYLTCDTCGEKEKFGTGKEILYNITQKAGFMEL